MQDNIKRFISPNEIQKESLCYSDGMGFESAEKFYINRSHFHNYLIMYTISGQLICSQNSENIAVDPGEAVLLDLHDQHQYYFAKGIPSRIAWTHINGAPVAKVMESVKKLRQLPIKMSLPDIYSKLLALFEVSDQPNQDIFRQSELCYSMLMDFLKEEWSHHTNSPETHRLEEFRRIMWEFISHNLHRNITLDELAAEASLSKYHFIRIFQSAFDVSPMQFVLEEKMRRAKYQLQNTTESIYQISDSLGFSAPGYFSKVFKQAVGVTPSEYRENDRHLDYKV